MEGGILVINEYGHHLYLSIGVHFNRLSEYDPFSELRIVLSRFFQIPNRNDLSFTMNATFGHNRLA